MCNCMKEALEILSKDFPEWQGKKVSNYQFSDSGINFTTGKIQHNIGIDISFEKQIKKGHTLVKMDYCPLCGKELKES